MTESARRGGAALASSMSCDVHTSAWLSNPPSQPTHNTLTPLPQDQRTKLTEDEGKRVGVRRCERLCERERDRIKQFLTSEAGSQQHLHHFISSPWQLICANQKRYCTFPPTYLHNIHFFAKSPYNWTHQ